MTCSTDQKVSGPGLLDASVPLNLDRSVSFVADKSDERGGGARQPRLHVERFE